MPFGSEFTYYQRDLSAQREAERKKLIAKGLVPRSNKLQKVLSRVMRQKYGV